MEPGPTSAARKCGHVDIHTGCNDCSPVLKALAQGVARGDVEVGTGPMGGGMTTAQREWMSRGPAEVRHLLDLIGCAASGRVMSTALGNVFALVQALDKED